jgi:energy-coupling factor transporter ATP-binding protein EcfA2
MRVKIIKDEIVERICKEYTYDFREFIDFEEHILDKTLLPNNYNLGLIVGSSGSGKSILLKEFGTEVPYVWDKNKAIVSHFKSYEDAIHRLMGAGLNSVPSWLKPYNALSDGQKYRADLAISINNNVVKDEFTSVIDRGTALGLANSIQKLIRDEGYQNIVFASVHKDIIEYLRPDWIYDTDEGVLTVNSDIWDMEYFNKVDFVKKHFMEI